MSKLEVDFQKGTLDDQLRYILKRQTGKVLRDTLAELINARVENLPRRDYYDNPTRVHDIPCQYCGSKEWVDWLLLPHELFNVVCPGGSGYLCFDCFVKNHPLAKGANNE